MRQRDREWKEISYMLERLLSGKEVMIQETYEDSIEEKVKHQIVRLSEMIRGRERQMAEERDGIKELIAEIAHQMRMPLANMESYMDLLESSSSFDDSKAESERREYLQALRESEGKLRFLTESFIKMARLENRIIQIKPRRNDLYETLLNCILAVKKQAYQKNCFISLKAEEKLQSVYDENWLHEAVCNVLENSIKYSGENGEIEVEAQRGEMYTRISVRDSGAGIEEGEENKIFQRFYRGKGADGQPGFGLGLYIAREILLLHGGFVKAKRQNPGMEISLFLP